MRRDVFQALADPVRRQILTLVAVQALSLNQVADQFAISRQAISKHVKILSECGLIVMVPQGRERICQLQPEKLNNVSDWLSSFHKMLEERFDRLDQMLANTV